VVPAVAVETAVALKTVVAGDRRSPFVLGSASGEYRDDADGEAEAEDDDGDGGEGYASARRGVLALLGAPTAAVISCTVGHGVPLRGV